MLNKDHKLNTVSQIKSPKTSKLKLICAKHSSVNIKLKRKLTNISVQTIINYRKASTK